MLESELQKAREEAATLEARLLILRQRARAGARSMQDRGTNRSGRNAAGSSWAYARVEAEKVERELQAAQKKVQDLESKPAVFTSTPQASKQTDENDRPPGATELRNNTLYYTHEQAARRLSISALELEALISSARLQPVSVGGRHLFPAASVNRLAEAPSKKPSGAAHASTDNAEQPTAGDHQTEFYYNLQQAAEMLGLKSSGVSKLVSRGDLPVKWINKQIWYPAQPLEDLVRRKFGPGPLARAPKPQPIRMPTGQQPDKRSCDAVSRQPDDRTQPKGGSPARNRSDYYTVDEVSRKLNEAHHEIWRMAFSGTLQVEPVGNQRLFLKQQIDDLVVTRRSATSGLREAAVTPKPNAGSSSASVEGSEYYTVEQVAEKLGMDNADEVWHLPNVGQLKMKGEKIGGQRVFSKEAVDKLVLKHKEAQASQEKSPLQAGTVAHTTSRSEDEYRAVGLRSGEDFYYTPAQAARILGRIFYKAVRNTIPTVTVGDQIWCDAEVVNNLAKQKYGGGKLHNAPTPHRLLVPKGIGQKDGKGPPQADLRALREANERLREELQRERDERLRQAQRMRRNADQLEAELEDMRRNSSDGVLGPRLRQERELRQEAERRAHELHSQLTEEKILNSSRARRVAALEAELDHSETRRTQLEEALSSEKEKARRLGESERLLNDIRRVLGGGGAAHPPDQGSDDAPNRTKEHTPEKVSGELALRTPFGQVSFTPPFPLAEQEEELLRLIAKEDEVTAEQIHRHTGRRRAARELEDLLDRLADEGVKDLVVEVSEDRYRFNPAALQDN